MGASLNASEAQERLISAAGDVMYLLKDRLYDSLEKGMGELVAKVAEKKHDGDEFQESLVQAVKSSGASTSVSQSGGVVSFPAEVNFSTASQQEMWNVSIGGNLRTLGKNHEHTHARPGQQVWGKGIHEQHQSEAKTEREIPQWDYEGVGANVEYEIFNKNAVDNAFGSNYGQAKQIIAAKLVEALNLNISIS